MKKKMTREEKKTLAIRISCGVVCAAMVIGIVYMIVSGILVR